MTFWVTAQQADFRQSHPVSLSWGDKTWHHGDQKYLEFAGIPEKRATQKDNFGYFFSSEIKLTKILLVYSIP